jgi:hypothetical protein
MPAEQNTVDEVQARLNASLAVDRLFAFCFPDSIIAEQRAPADPADPALRDDVVTLLKEVARVNAELRKVRTTIRQALGCVKAAHEKLDAAGAS